MADHGEGVGVAGGHRGGEVGPDVLRRAGPWHQRPGRAGRVVSERDRNPVVGHRVGAVVRVVQAEGRRA